MLQPQHTLAYIGIGIATGIGYRVSVLPSDHLNEKPNTDCDGDIYLCSIWGRSTANKVDFWEIFCDKRGLIICRRRVWELIEGHF